MRTEIVAEATEKKAMTEMMKRAEEGWRTLIRAEEGWDEADEDMTTEDVREYTDYVINEIGIGFFFGQITEEMMEWAR